MPAHGPRSNLPEAQSSRTVEGVGRKLLEKDPMVSGLYSLLLVHLQFLQYRVEGLGFRSRI